MIGFIAIIAWTHMIDCDSSQKLGGVQNYYWEKSQTGIIIVGKIPERIKLVGKISSTINIHTIHPIKASAGVNVRNPKVNPWPVFSSGTIPYHMASANMAKNKMANAVEVL